MSNEPAITGDEFNDICKAFMDETEWPLVYNASLANTSYSNYLHDDDSEVIVERVDGEVAGVAIVTLDFFAHSQPFGYLVKFYVYPQHWGSAVSENLMRRVGQWFDKRGTVADFATPLAKIGDSDKALNLLRRFGYTNEAIQLYRENK